MTQEAYVSFEVAKLLREKGFDEECFYCYDKHGDRRSFTTDIICLCPTQQMAMRWLREMHNIIIEPDPVWNGRKWEYLLFIVTPQNASSPYYEHNPYFSYEECVETGIKYCLKNLI